MDPDLHPCLEVIEMTVFCRTFQWGVDSVHHVKYNQVETHLLGAAASDNSIILYDTRNVGPVRKVVMNLRSNAIAWNPMEVRQSPLPYPSPYSICENCRFQTRRKISTLFTYTSSYSS